MPDTNNMISLAAAREIVATVIGNVKLPTEEIPLRQATGRILAEDQLSAIDIPPFNKSAMDGYAIPP
ncbi:MAG: hypothetical protein ACYSOV_00890, partial [Planctomycetota bacterium]